MHNLSDLNCFCIALNYKVILNYCPNYYEIREYLKLIKEKEKNELLLKYIDNSILYCDLIEYISNYSNYKNDYLDKIIDELDFTMSKTNYKNEIEYKIFSNDIYRLITTLNRNLNIIKNFNKEETIIDLDFPLSWKQKNLRKKADD